MSTDSTTNTIDKYDRQLRLWGAQGQKALSETCVCLIRASAAGTETLKNLVLPGIGSILVLDDASCEHDSVHSSNFFAIQSKDCNKPRAQVATELLLELNSDVQGEFQHVPDLSHVDYAAVFQAIQKPNVLVVASDLEPPLLEQVAATCYSLKLSLIVVQAYGLLGVVRLQTPTLPIMNPKPRASRPDLRLTSPFPGLLEIAKSIQWKDLENHQHGHVPYPLILLSVMEQWKASNVHSSNKNTLPHTFSEKQDFQKLIQEASRDFNMELNFQEAHKNAYLAYAPQELDLEQLHDLHSKSKNSCSTLHLLLSALFQFLANRDNNQAPLHGSIPDMTASTDLYVKLQTAYKQQADRDFQEMRLLTPPHVSDNDVAIFCQNVFALDVLQTRTIADEYNFQADNDDNNTTVCEDLIMAVMEGDGERPDMVPLLWYMGLSACRLFYNRVGRYPGLFENAYERDVAQLKDCILEIVNQYGLQEVVKETLVKNVLDYAQELTRYGNAEIHTIASVIGGVASQEAVKVITGQYVPINNTYVYNGIASTGGVYTF
jgi:amyloid beta precursor protein binding protein 1